MGKHLTAKAIARLSSYSFGFIVCILSLLQMYRFVNGYGPRHEKTGLRVFANNKGADQPAHSHSLISTFVICLLESMISNLAISAISIFYLVSEVEQTGFGMTW